MVRTKSYIVYERNAKQKISDLQTAPKMHVLCIIKYASLPGCLSLKVNAPQYFKEKPSESQHYTLKRITILLSGHYIMAAFFKKVEFNIDVYKQCTELVFFFLCVSSWLWYLEFLF